MMKIIGTRLSLYTCCISALFILAGCSSNSGGGDDPVSELYIKSAVYDNNRTATVSDDTLYLYFNKSIDFNTLLVDNNISDFLSIDGNGTIDPASVVDYNDTNFHRVKISLGAASELFSVDTTQIALVPSLFSGLDVSSYKVAVRTFRPMLKTGQTTSYTRNDDGAYQKGIARSYTDNGNGTVKDNATGIIWEQEDDGALRTWNEAQTYCKNLDKASLTWRMPSIEELIYLMDKGTSHPAIDDIFVNVKSTAYWSANDYLLKGEDNAWTVNTPIGNTNDPDKNATYYIRCVSADNDGMNEVDYIRDNARQIVLDTSTNLIWQDDASVIDEAKVKNWQEAIDVCEALTLDGKTDWRLPNLDELNSITDKTKSSPAMSDIFVNKVQRTYWSSTTNESNTSKAWYSYFGCGCNDVEDKIKSYNVRCVRSEN